jgi:hypothetical protein
VRGAHVGDGQRHSWLLRPKVRQGARLTLHGLVATRSMGERSCVLFRVDRVEAQGVAPSGQRHGCVSNQGPAEVRGTLVEATWHTGRTALDVDPGHQVRLSIGLT